MAARGTRGVPPHTLMHTLHLNKINGGRCARKPPLGRHVRVAPRDPHAAACGSAPPTHAAGDARKRDPLARPRHLAPLTQAQNSAQVTLHQADRATAIDANVLDDERRGNRRAIHPITLVTHRLSPRKTLSPVARALCASSFSQLPRRREANQIESQHAKPSQNVPLRVISRQLRQPRQIKTHPDTQSTPGTTPDSI